MGNLTSLEARLEVEAKHRAARIRMSKLLMYAGLVLATGTLLFNTLTWMSPGDVPANPWAGLWWLLDRTLVLLGGVGFGWYLIAKAERLLRES